MKREGGSKEKKKGGIDETQGGETEAKRGGGDRERGSVGAMESKDEIKHVEQHS